MSVLDIPGPGIVRSHIRCPRAGEPRPDPIGVPCGPVTIQNAGGPRRTAHELMLRRRRRAVVVLSALIAIAGVVFAVLGNRPATGPGRAEGPVGRTAADATAAPSKPTPSSKPTATRAADPLAVRARPVARGSGRLHVVPGSSPTRGSGPVRRYLVEVEGGLPESGRSFADAVDRVLGDPRSWGHDGAQSFRRVSGGAVDVRVVLASAHETDVLCARAGLSTDGSASCFNGTRAVVNQTLWEQAVPWFDGDLPRYRAYVLNHEIGHALGHHHENCPGVGRPAPVMQQQTYGMQGCRPNGWPFPG